MDEETPLIFRKDRIGSGVRALDVMLEGGYKHPGTIMIIAPAGPEKACFAAHFVNDGMARGDAVIYITTDKTAEEIEKSAAGWDLHFKGPGAIFYIDCYSQQGGTANGKANVSSVGGPGALNEISLFISDILRNNEGRMIRMVFHSFSTFALYNESGPLFKFLQVVEGRLKKANGTLMLLVEEGMHDDRFLTTLRHGIDEEYGIKNVDKKKELTSDSLPIPVPIKVGPLGVEVE